MSRKSLFPFSLSRYLRFFCSLLVLSQVGLAHSEEITWPKFEDEVAKQTLQDERQGLSYLISGGLAVASGLVGDSMTSDPLEKGVYAVFQTIGVAAIGIGYYQWKIGGEDRETYKTLKDLRHWTSEQKTEFLQLRRAHIVEKQLQERRIRLVTHSLIALINIYNASKQTNSSVRNTLGFIAGVNVLAAISYSF